MDHIAVPLSDEHRANLATLADFLERSVPPPEFGMGSYAWQGTFCLSPSEAVESYHECGTTACAVGHGPLAGFLPLPGEHWGDYELRVFGVTVLTVGERIAAWYWMFSDSWELVDNTPQGAAARIRWFLANGVPENWRRQRNGQAPLCYAVPPVEVA